VSQLVSDKQNIYAFETCVYIAINVSRLINLMDN